MKLRESSWNKPWEREDAIEAFTLRWDNRGHPGDIIEFMVVEHV